MEKNKKIILLIEDNKLIIDLVVIVSEDENFELISARTLKEAEVATEDVSPYDLIFLDGSLGVNTELNTLPILAKIKSKGFDKPIIGISNSHNDKLVRAGATHGVSKDRIINEILKIL